MKPNYFYLAFVAIVLVVAAMWFRSLATKTNAAHDEYHERTQPASLR